MTTFRRGTGLTFLLLLRFELVALEGHKPPDAEHLLAAQVAPVEIVVDGVARGDRKPEVVVDDVGGLLRVLALDLVPYLILIPDVLVADEDNFVSVGHLY